MATGSFKSKLVAMVVVAVMAEVGVSVLVPSGSSMAVRPACAKCHQHQHLQKYQQAPDSNHRTKRFALAAGKPANKNAADGDTAGGNRDGSEALVNGLLMDSKVAENVTSSLNDMTQNLRRMFMENRHLQNQLQDVFGRLQNITGVNVTTVTKNMPKSASGLANVVMNRLQQQQQQQQQRPTTQQHNPQ